MMIYNFSNGDTTIQKEFASFSEVLNEFTKSFENLFRFFAPVYNDFALFRDKFVWNEAVRIGQYVWNFWNTEDYGDYVDTNEYEDNGETWVEEIERMLAD